MGTKTEPGNFDCYSKAGDKEELFTLRAHDPLAPWVIRFWCILRYFKEYFDANPSELPSSKLKEAWTCAKKMEAWRSSNP